MAERPTFPARVVRKETAQATFGSLLDRLGPSFYRSDDLADAAIEALQHTPGRSMNQMLDRALHKDDSVPEAFKNLVAAAENYPVWVDDARIDRAGTLLFRSGVSGAVTLGAKSLLSGYTSPGGNKPLAWSGQLQSTVSRRLAETAKFVVAVAEPGGMHPRGQGFRITLKVRLIHAQVRALIQRQTGWRTELWGTPINQHDMMATILLFSVSWLEGVEALGIHISEEEAEDYMHLWRLVGHVIGVEHDLLPASRAEGLRLNRFIELTEGAPDSDSRKLVHAFLNHPLERASTDDERRIIQRRVRAFAGIVRGLLGDTVADQLDLPRDGWRYIVPAMRQVIRRAERVRRRIPGGERLAIEAGRHHWNNVIELGLEGLPAEFALPTRLAGLAA